MAETFLAVVGDKFSDFAAGKSAVTLSQLRALLTLPPAFPVVRDPAHDRLVLVPGQGLSDADLREMQALALSSAHKDAFDLDLWQARPPRAGGALSHKRRAENTLISEPRRTGEHTFDLDLLVDENCEMMSDHQTGQHLQGMMLIEAARQSFLAVTEQFFLPQDAGKFYFVFDDLSVSYKRFVFPVDATLGYAIREMDPSPNRQRFVVEVTIEQCGHEVAVVNGTFTVVKDARITRMESGMAREALESHLAVAAASRGAADVAEAA